MLRNSYKREKYPIWRQALIIIAFLQVVLSFSIRALPVIGPEITTAAGVEPHDIGIIAGVMSIGTMCFLLGGNLTIDYYGPVRILQIDAAIGIIGVLLSLTVVWWLFIPAAFLIGIGYGPSPTAASDLLIRTSPPNRTSLIMSTKQAGVPLGGALAGVLLPAVVVFADWQAALLVTAAFSLAGILIVQPWRKQLDNSRNMTKRPTAGNLFAWENLTTPFRVLREIPGMLPLTLAVAFFSCVQGCILAFFVTQLTTECGFPLAVAGTAFSAMQVSGTFSRIIMGWLADRLGNAKTLLLLAMISAATILVLAYVGQNWPTWLILMLGFCLGITSISWNGVYLAEIGRIAPHGRVGAATSGSTFFLFVAYALGPFIFSFGVPAVGSYSICFFVVAFIQLLAVPALLRCMRLTA